MGVFLFSLFLFNYLQPLTLFAEKIRLFFVILSRLGKLILLAFLQNIFVCSLESRHGCKL